MESARPLRDVFAGLAGEESARRAHDADPGGYLGAHGHAELPGSLVAEAIIHYADVAPVEVAEHLAQFVMAHSPVPLDTGGDGETGTEGGSAQGLELLATAPAVTGPDDDDLPAGLDGTGELITEAGGLAGEEGGLTGGAGELITEAGELIDEAWGLAGGTGELIDEAWGLAGGTGELIDKAGRGSGGLTAGEEFDLDFGRGDTEPPEVPADAATGVGLTRPDPTRDVRPDLVPAESFTGDAGPLGEVAEPAPEQAHEVPGEEPGEGREGVADL